MIGAGIGDSITFQVIGNMPRWDMNQDRGDEDPRTWAYGEIVEIDENYVQVSYEIKGYTGAGNCYFPNDRHPAYKEDQWSYDGYLTLIVMPETDKKVCECGSDSTYGRNSAHDWYCPRYVKY